MTTRDDLIRDYQRMLNERDETIATLRAEVERLRTLISHAELCRACGCYVDDHNSETDAAAWELEGGCIQCDCALSQELAISIGWDEAQESAQSIATPYSTPTPTPGSGTGTQSGD